MISKKYTPNTIDNSKQQAENVESARSKREWEDPVMVEVMRAADAHDTLGGGGSDGLGCGSL